MATIFRVRRFRVVIHSDDHHPPHVHVIGPGLEAKVALALPGRNPYILTNNGFSPRQIAAVLVEIEANQVLLLERWRQIHGDA